MKVLVSATGGSLDSPVDQRFGRAPFYIIVDTEKEDDYEAIQNPFAMAPSSAGISSAQLAIQKGVKAVISGAVGPNASMVLMSAGIKIYSEPEPISVKEALEKLKSKSYSEAKFSQPQPPIYGYHGPFWGGFYQPPVPYFNEESFLETRISMLKTELEFLERRLKEIRKFKEEK